jgi:hypothetical protein
VTKDAYILFYRKRGFSATEPEDFKKMMRVPETRFDDITKIKVELTRGKEPLRMDTTQA